MKPTSLHVLRLLLLTLGPFAGNLLHAEEISETRVLKGKITVENGKHYFVLKAPLEMEGKLLDKLDLRQDQTGDPNTKKLLDTQGSETFIFLQGAVGKNTGYGNPQFTIKPMVFDKNSGVIDSPNRPSSSGVQLQTTLLPQTTQNFTSNTTNNTTVNNTTLMLSPTAPAKAATDPDSKLAGNWKTTTDTGSINFLGQSGSFGTHFSLDLEKDRKGICRIGASAPFGLSNGVSFFGTWRTSTHQGIPTLVFDIKDYSSESIKIGNVPQQIVWYIKHVGESTLVLRENKTEYQLSK